MAAAALKSKVFLLIMYLTPQRSCRCVHNLRHGTFNDVRRKMQKNAPIASALMLNGIRYGGLLAASRLPKTVLRQKLCVTTGASLLSKTGLNYLRGAASRRLGTAKIASLNLSRRELRKRRTLKGPICPGGVAGSEDKVPSTLGTQSNRVPRSTMSTLKHVVIHSAMLAKTARRF